MKEQRIIPQGEQVLMRLLGKPAVVVARQDIPVNSLIDATCHLVHAEAHELPEEHGRLQFLPLGDDRCSVILEYLLHLDAEAPNAAIWSVRFHPDFFLQWPMELLQQQQAFRFDKSTEQQLQLCQQSRRLLETLGQDPVASLTHSLQQTETAIHLFRRAVDSLNVPFTACPVPACRFLAYDSEREKVFRAREILDQQTDGTISIKDLSRKVAMNECYLKKGFKTLTGKTIHEYQHDRRIERAKLLLQQEGRSVSDVAAELGFSSISHFSTAFKKATGLKPCELLR